jgi:hypothetical protein
MKMRTPVVWFSVSGVIFVLAVLSNTADLLVPSVLAAGVGVGTLFPALKEKWMAEARKTPQPQRIEQLEERLRVTEEELTSASRELAMLKEQRDFDLQLLGKSNAVNNPR